MVESKRAIVRLRLFFRQSDEHTPNRFVFRARLEHFDARLVRTPFQNIDIDVANSPSSHFQSRSFVEIDRVRADKCCAVVVNNKFLFGLDDSKFGSEWKARPIRGGAADEVPGKVIADSIAPPSRFATAIRGCTNIDAAVFIRGTFLGSGRLERATGEQASDGAGQSNFQPGGHSQEVR
jgi:hypothetical protein